MERFPSIGIAELVILAVAAGLVLLVGVVVVVLVVKIRRGNSTEAARLDGSETAAKGSRGLWKWILLVVLSSILVVPLCVVVGGVLLVTPVRQTTVLESGVHVVEQGSPMSTLPPAMTETFETPSKDAQSSGAAQPASTPPGSSALLSLNPFNPATFVLLFGLAGLTLLLGVAVVAAVGKGWKGVDEPSGAIQVNRDSQDNGFRAAKLRSVLLALILWIALSAYLILDLVFQVSLYWQFVVMYTALWLLVGALLLTGRPLRDKLLILGLFVLVLGSVRFVDWNSRKPFLRDLYRVQEGMTQEQVDQTMSGYLKAYGGGPPASQAWYEDGEIVTGWVTYRHTNEGWGDSDWGVVTFENGRVVHRRFLAD